MIRVALVQCDVMLHTPLTAPRRARVAPWCRANPKTLLSDTLQVHRKTALFLFSFLFVFECAGVVN